MVDYLLVIPLLCSFLITLFLLPRWINKARGIGLVWDDMNKYLAPKVSGSGGLVVMLGFILGIFVFVAYRVFYLRTSDFLIEIITAVLVIVIASGVGLIDDLLGWRKGGLSRRSRLILMLFAAIPLMAINAGKSSISLPFNGVVDVGLIYPLIFIPLGIIGATATYNFLAGHNGLEAGQGIILLAGMALVAFFTGNSWLSVIALCMIVALIAFLFFNFYPAKVLGGDVLTYAIGSMVAIIAILGNFEKIALFFFIPFILETILKSRGKLKKASFGKPNKDGSLDPLYDKIYGLEHVAIFLMKKLNIKATEKKLVYMLWAFQLIIVILGFIIFRKGIFI